MVPEKYTDQDTESKGFYDPVIVQDLPLRGKKVFLNIQMCIRDRYKACLSHRDNQ